MNLAKNLEGDKVTEVREHLLLALLSFYDRSDVGSK